MQLHNRKLFDAEISNAKILAFQRNHHINQLSQLNSSWFQVFRSTYVLLIGLGGIGSHVLPNVVDLGFNVLAFDPDTVERSNLSRQNYTEDQIGLKKVSASAINLLNTFGPIDPHTTNNSLSNYYLGLPCSIMAFSPDQIVSKLNLFPSYKSESPVIVIDATDLDYTRSAISLLPWDILQCRLGTLHYEVQYISEPLRLCDCKPTPRDQSVARMSAVGIGSFVAQLLVLWALGRLHKALYSYDFLRMQTPSSNPPVVDYLPL